jgi:hypothetical protein
MANPSTLTVEKIGDLMQGIAALGAANRRQPCQGERGPAMHVPGHSGGLSLGDVARAAPLAAPAAAGDDAELIALLEQLGRDIESVQAQIFMACAEGRGMSEPIADDVTPFTSLEALV